MLCPGLPSPSNGVKPCIRPPDPEQQHHLPPDDTICRFSRYDGYKVLEQEKEDASKMELGVDKSLFVKVRENILNTDL